MSLGTTMSESNPIPATTLRCNDCGEPITVGRSEHRTLRATCECDGVALKVDELLPAGWSA